MKAKRNFEQVVRDFKSKESIEDISCLVTSDLKVNTEALCRIVVAWPKMEITRKGKSVEFDTDEPLPKMWKRLWESVSFQWSDLALYSGVTSQSVKSLFSILSGNRIVYPDGTVSEFAKQYIRMRLKDRLVE